MELTPYRKMITYAKEKKDELFAPVRAREMCKKAELEIAKLEGEILKRDQKIAEHCSEYPVDFDKLIDAIDAKELLGRRKEQFEEIVKQMFPVEE